MNKRKIKDIKFKKYKKRNPFFHWPLILLLFVVIEVMLLIQERAWSQNYVEIIDNLRDQAEILSLENQKMFNNLFNFYNLVLSMDNNESYPYLVKAKREFFNAFNKFSFIKNH
ncbi:MAG: hypothetical protein KatS3mg094_611 [Candidatus Parcubacteria bacterium]|nr:MAG: hypothetical protein KatS3mg094_611 [Candidatus Parcubacteria bacterium]